MMLIPIDTYPPGWSKFNDNTVPHRFKDFGFSGTPADLNRFVARYRIARCFRHVEFEGLSRETADGYSALAHLFLAYSAFEVVLRLLGIRQTDTEQLLRPAEREIVLARVRALDRGDALFYFIHGHVNKTHKTQLNLYLSGVPCNPFYLASSMRHLFAHGLLTANPAGGTVRSVAPLCRYLANFLFKVMDREFWAKALAFDKAQQSKKDVSGEQLTQGSTGQ